MSLDVLSKTHVPSVNPEVPNGIKITEAQMETIKATIAQGATREQLSLYLFDCQRRGVHPLDNLLYCIIRGGKYTPSTSIDFMRQRAEKTHCHIGTLKPIHELTKDGKPIKSTITVKKMVQGKECEFFGEARFAEYCPGPGNDTMWKKMPFTMLDKCAEALALRRGFPNEFAGIYVVEELDQMKQDAPVTPYSEEIGGNIWIKAKMTEYLPTKGKMPHKFRMQTPDGMMQVTCFHLPETWTPDTVNASMSEEIEFTYTKSGKYLNLDGLRFADDPPPMVPQVEVPNPYTGDVRTVVNDNPTDNPDANPPATKAVSSGGPVVTIDDFSQVPDSLYDEEASHIGGAVRAALDAVNRVAPLAVEMNKDEDVFAQWYQKWTEDPHRNIIVGDVKEVWKIKSPYQLGLVKKNAFMVECQARWKRLQDRVGKPGGPMPVMTQGTR